MPAATGSAGAFTYPLKLKDGLASGTAFQASQVAAAGSCKMNPLPLPMPKPAKITLVGVLVPKSVALSRAVFPAAVDGPFGDENDAAVLAVAKSTR